VRIYSDLRVPIVYDSDNTNYYVDPSSSSVLNSIYTDTVNSVAVGDPLELCYVRGNEVRIGPSGGNLPIKAATYYDYADTSYYVDPNGTSILNAINSSVITGVSGAGVTGLDMATNDNYASMRVIRNSTASGSFADGMYIGYANGNGGATRIYGQGSTSSALIKFSTYTYEPGSFRAPIFYDSNNTAYYANPAGESVFSTVTFFGELNLSAAGQTYVDHTGTIIFRNQSGYATSATLTTSGNFTATGNVTAYSDIRVKDNVKQIEGALDKVQAIRGVTYNRTDLEDTERRYGGVIAQEIEKVLPEAIFESDDRKAVDYNATIGLLIEAIKELKAEVETLKKG